MSYSNQGLNPIDAAPDLDNALRSDLYRLIAALLAAAPGRELLDWLGSPVPEQALPASLQAAWRALREAAAEVSPEDADDTFHRLFIGVARGELMPYGSWYQTGYLMETPLVALRQELAALGLERERGVSEPEDHMAALCDVMAALTDPDGAGCDGEQRVLVQQRFFRNHLEPWWESFFGDLEATRAAFYAPLGGFAQAFLARERLLLGA